MPRTVPILALLALAAVGHADGLLGVMFRTGGQTDGSKPVLYDVNPLTGATSNARSINVNFCIGIASAPDGRLFGMTDNLGRINNVSGQGGKSLLFSIDPATGLSTAIGRADPTGTFGVNEGDLAFSPSGQLWGLSTTNGGLGGSLFRIDTATGLASSFVTIAQDTTNRMDTSAMAFAPNGDLYVLDTALDIANSSKQIPARVLKVNPITGAYTVAYQSNTIMGGAAGMTYDRASGRFLLTDGDFEGTNTLYSFDPANPGFTTIGAVATATGTQSYMRGLSGLTSVAPVPEPATLAALAMGGLALLRRRRRS